MSRIEETTKMSFSFIFRIFRTVENQKFTIVIVVYVFHQPCIYVPCWLVSEARNKQSKVKYAVKVFQPFCIPHAYHWNAKRTLFLLICMKKKSIVNRPPSHRYTQHSSQSHTFTPTTTLRLPSYALIIFHSIVYITTIRLFNHYSHLGHVVDIMHGTGWLHTGRTHQATDGGNGTDTMFRCTFECIIIRCQLS